MAKSDIVKAVAVTAELMGATLSEIAAKVLCEDLLAYQESQVLKALVRCRRECEGNLTIKKILDRLDDGRPGVEEAWSMLPKSEADSVVWTAEIAEAFGDCLPLIQEGDMIAARMAFKEKYLQLVQTARNEQRSVVWVPSLGHDLTGREQALFHAVEKGRLSQERVKALLPSNKVTSFQVGRLINTTTRRLKNG